MAIWYVNKQGDKEFRSGDNDWITAARTAESCPHFVLDDEDELVAEEPRSCYNCRYRHWTESSFVCLKR